MESMSVLERLSELLPALPPGPHRSMGPACAVRRAGMLIPRGCRFAFCGALRTDPRPFRQEEPAGALFPPAGAVRQFSELAFPCVLRGPRLSKVVPYETFPPLYQAGLYLSAGLLLGGTIIWTVVVAALEAAARLARAARFPRVPDRKQPCLPPHHGLILGQAWPCRARSCRKRTTFRR